MKEEIKLCTRCGKPKSVDKEEFSLFHNKRNKKVYVNNICKACARLTVEKKNQELKAKAKPPVVDFGNDESVKEWNRLNSFKWTYVEEIK